MWNGSLDIQWVSTQICGFSWKAFQSHPDWRRTLHMACTPPPPRWMSQCRALASVWLHQLFSLIVFCKIQTRVSIAKGHPWWKMKPSRNNNNNSKQLFRIHVVAKLWHWWFSQWWRSKSTSLEILTPSLQLLVLDWANKSLDKARSTLRETAPLSRQADRTAKWLRLIGPWSILRQEVKWGHWAFPFWSKILKYNVTGRSFKCRC